METRETLEQAYSEIEKWEREQKDLWFWEKLGRLPFVLLDRYTPAAVQEKLGAAVDEIASYLEHGGTYLVQEKAVYERFQPYLPTGTAREPLSSTEVSRLPLATMDAVARDLRHSRAAFATVQGATTGIGGLFTLAVDIPLLVGTSLKVLQEMALCYGYRPEEKRERMFVIKCLQFSSSDIVGKKAILEELAAFDAQTVRSQTLAQLQGWREVIMTYTENFGWKKLFQMVPIAGILFGAYLNRSAVQDVAEAGMMLYRKRRILQRLRELGES
ncbi:EcsC family protein [Brevibacillus sp. H7]|uniref:EcsC family protein n=1 Tax=Brevibacillus sp. H7 TaxID=3349138 RepID=UPI0038133EEE